MGREEGKSTLLKAETGLGSNPSSAASHLGFSCSEL